MFSTNVEFNGLSSTIYRNGILELQLKSLAKIYFSVTCTHVVVLQAWSYILLK